LILQIPKGYCAIIFGEQTEGRTASKHRNPRNKTLKERSIKRRKKGEPFYKVPLQRTNAIMNDIVIWVKKVRE